MGLRGGLFGIFFVHFLLMQRDGEQKIFFVNQQKRNLHEHTLSKTLINRAFRDMHGSTATKLLLKPVAPISARCSNKSYIGLYFR